MNIPQLVDELWQVHKDINAEYRSDYKEMIEDMYDEGLGALIEVCQYIVNTEIEIPEDDE
jgi:hypothetical protein